jgi:glycosyltransferase involved in cell wall biosynthesis
MNVYLKVNKMNQSPILSLCIRTYNRANILEKTISRIVSCRSFDSDVELVISDNCSTDNTRQVCEHFAAKYDNVKYYCNEKNTLDYNFIQVLNRGKGQYLKLLNDWCYPTEEGLAIMKRFLLNNKDRNIPVFFTSGWARAKKKQFIECSNLDDYIKEISVMVTFNNLFGTWKSDWDSLKNKERFTSLKLLQVDWTYGIVGHKGALLCNERILELAPEMRKVVRQGYNYFQVMFNNYYAIMQTYVEQGFIKSSTVELDKKHFLQHFRPELFQVLICHYGKYWNYDTTGTWQLLFNDYKYKPYFYVYILMLPFQWLFHASIRDFGR